MTKEKEAYDNVGFVGAVDDGALGKVLRAADIFFPRDGGNRVENVLAFVVDGGVDRSARFDRSSHHDDSSDQDEDQGNAVDTIHHIGACADGVVTDQGQQGNQTTNLRKNEDSATKRRITKRKTRETYNSQANETPFGNAGVL
jgi:hypothetical protein